MPCVHATWEAGASENQLSAPLTVTYLVHGIFSCLIMVMFDYGHVIYHCEPQPHEHL